MDGIHRSQLSNKVRWLARGPNVEAKSFKRYVCNGKKFRTKMSEMGKTTQNSGVAVTTIGGPTYYGQITSIIELNYFDEARFVLFKCDWVDVTVGRGYKVDEFGFELVNFSRLIHTGDRLIDDPFIMSSQADQVYYVADERHPNWLVVVKTKPRDVYDLGDDEVFDDDVDDYCINEPYNLNNQDIPGDANDELIWTRNDVEGLTIDMCNAQH